MLNQQDNVSRGNEKMIPFSMVDYMVKRIEKCSEKQIKDFVDQPNLFLEQLGYPMKGKGFLFFQAVVEEVVECMEQYSDEEVKAIIGNKKSHIYTEPACFYFEVGLNRFHQELNIFQQNSFSINSKTLDYYHKFPLDDVIFIASKLEVANKELQKTKINKKVGVGSRLIEVT